MKQNAANIMRAKDNNNNNKRRKKKRITKDLPSIQRRKEKNLIHRVASSSTTPTQFMAASCLHEIPPLAELLDHLMYRTYVLGVFFWIYIPTKSFFFIFLFALWQLFFCFLLYRVGPPTYIDGEAAPPLAQRCIVYDQQPSVGSKGQSLPDGYGRWTCMCILVRVCLNILTPLGFLKSQTHTHTRSQQLCIRVDDISDEGQRVYLTWERERLYFVQFKFNK